MTGVAAGETLVAFTASQIVGDTIVVTSGADGAFTNRSNFDAGSGVGGDFFVLEDASAGSHTVSVTGSTGACCLIVAHVAAALTWDQAAAEQETTGASIAVTALSDSGADAVLFHPIAPNTAANPWTLTPDSGWTLPANGLEINGKSNMCAAMPYRVVSSSGSYGATHPQNVTDQYAVRAQLLQAPGAGEGAVLAEAPTVAAAGSIAGADAVTGGGLVYDEPDRPVAVAGAVARSDGALGAELQRALALAAGATAAANELTHDEPARPVAATATAGASGPRPAGHALRRVRSPVRRLRRRRRPRRVVHGGRLGQAGAAGRGEEDG